MVTGRPVLVSPGNRERTGVRPRRSSQKHPTRFPRSGEDCCWSLVSRRYLVRTAVGHPAMESCKYPLVGDAKIFEIQRVIIDVDAAKVIRLQMPPDPHRSSLCDDVECDGPCADVAWSSDAKQLAFV